MAISKRLRFEILRRDNHTCRYCGAQAPDVPITVDHVIPGTLGGNDEPSNLVAACKDCNAGKSSVPADAPLVADVAADAIRWAAAMKIVAERRAQEIEDRMETFGWFNEIWCRWTDWRDDPFEVPGGYYPILGYLNAGLSKREMEDLVAVAMRANNVRDRWSYFCGCCRKRLEQNAELAAEIIQLEGGRTDG
jgi:hypothetical protein